MKRRAQYDETNNILLYILLLFILFYLYCILVSTSGVMILDCDWYWSTRSTTYSYHVQPAPHRKVTGTHIRVLTVHHRSYIL